MSNEKEPFSPYISAKAVMPELTPTAVVLGVVLSVVFGAANAYLGLRVGMTVSASIPAAVISMGVLRVIMKKDSILENNMVQTIGSAGESVAAGAIFTLPAMFMWMEEWGMGAPSMSELFLIALVGGVLGILFMLPLRRALIVEEHGFLPYPEGTACAEVLLAGEQGGGKAAVVFAGLGVSAVYKFIADGIKLFPSQLHYEIKQYKGAAVGADILPALVGVGYICGARIASYMLAGGVVGWLVLMPLMSLFGGSAVLFPAEAPINGMDSFTLWGNYIRYIGAGAVAAGGILSLIKSLPLIIKTFASAIGGLRKRGADGAALRTEKEIPLKYVLPGVLIITLAIWLLPVFPVPLAGAVIIAVFGFFFATVSARLVGLVGSSNNPVSGMAIATLLIATLLLKATGVVGRQGMLGAIAIGSIICIVAAIAGDTSQDLKTGYILGATPQKQQYGELIGVTSAALAIGGVLYLLNAAWGYGSANLPAPQAVLMKLVVEGVMGGTLPWVMVGAGAAIAVAAEILGIPVLPFAVGLYLPIHLSAGIMAGGLVRLFIEKVKSVTDEKRSEALERGVLYTSGMIAGEGLMGIALAVLAIIPAGGGYASVGEYLDASARGTSLGYLGSFAAFALLLTALLKASLFYKEKPQ